MIKSKSSFGRNILRNLHVSAFLLAALFFTIYGGVQFCDSLKYETVTVKVVKLQQQDLISSSGTTIRYIVVGDKETFICMSNVVNNKYNNSDLFLRLKKDSTYTFNVCGFGKTFFTDYRNILSEEK